MSNTSTSQSGGVGFVSLLTIVFITLKLLGKITWPWVWVLAPLWISTVLIILFFAVLILIAYLTHR
jgi:hypothetical protein